MSDAPMGVGPPPDSIEPSSAGASTITIALAVVIVPMAFFFFRSYVCSLVTGIADAEKLIVSNQKFPELLSKKDRDRPADLRTQYLVAVLAAVTLGTTCGWLLSGSIAALWAATGVGVSVSSAYWGGSGETAQRVQEN